MRELSVDPFLKDVTFAHPPPWPGHLGSLQARSTEVWRTPPLSLMPHLTRLPNAFWMPYFFLLRQLVSDTYGQQARMFQLRVFRMISKAQKVGTKPLEGVCLGRVQKEGCEPGAGL